MHVQRRVRRDAAYGAGVVVSGCEVWGRGAASVRVAAVMGGAVGTEARPAQGAGVSLSGMGCCAGDAQRLPSYGGGGTRDSDGRWWAGEGAAGASAALCAHGQDAVRTPAPMRRMGIPRRSREEAVKRRSGAAAESW